MFDHCLYFNTTALARLVERQWADAFNGFGLTPPQAFMLRMILARPGLLQRELAEALTISRPTATRLLDALEHKALVERRQAARDGRESEVHPTPAGAKLEAELNAASGKVTKRLKQLLGNAAFEQTVAQLRQTRDSLA